MTSVFSSQQRSQLQSTFKGNAWRKYWLVSLSLLVAGTAVGMAIQALVLTRPWEALWQIPVWLVAEALFFLAQVVRRSERLAELSTGAEDRGELNRNDFLQPPYQTLLGQLLGFLCLQVSFRELMLNR